MNRLKSLLIVCALLLCAVANAQFYGDNNVVVEDRPIAPFSAIELSGKMDVFITQGNAYSLKIETDANLQSFVVPSVRGNVLSVVAKNKNYSRLTVYITTMEAVYIDAKQANVRLPEGYKADKLLLNIMAGGSLQIDKSFSANELTVNLSGASSAASAYPLNITRRFQISAEASSKADLNMITSIVDIDALSGSRITLSGNADNLVVEASGLSNVNLVNLPVKTATLTSKSGATIDAQVSERVEGVRKSAGKINMIGTLPPYCNLQ